MQHEYWDCEGSLVRVDSAGLCERYRGAGIWERDKRQLHPRSRGLDLASDFTPIPEADLAGFMRAADRQIC